MTVFWFALLGLSVFVGGPVGAALVVGLWFVVAYLPGKKKEAQEEARYHQVDTDVSWDLDFRDVYDFQEMAMTSKRRSPGDDETICYELQRAGEGRWSMRMTEESEREQVAIWKKRAAEGHPGASEETIREAQENAWRPLSGQGASKIEVAYQRYIRSL
jgi:hypothetical protein